MPVYTYECKNCGVRFDRKQSFNDKPLTTCPECQKMELRKVFAPVGIIFKGSGWYSTDHRSASGQSKVRSKSGEADSKTESKAESKSEGESEN